MIAIDYLLHLFIIYIATFRITDIPRKRKFYIPGLLIFVFFSILDVANIGYGALLDRTLSVGAVLLVIGYGVGKEWFGHLLFVLLCSEFLGMLMMGSVMGWMTLSMPYVLESNLYFAFIFSMVGLVYLIVAQILKWKRRKIPVTALQRKEIVLLILSITLFGFYISSFQHAVFGEGLENPVLISTLSGLGGFLIVGIIALFIIQRRNLIYSEVMQKAQEKIMQEQHAYYHSLKQQDEEIKKMKHDLNEHMSVISSVLCKKNYEQLEDYLKEQLDALDDLHHSQIISTGSSFVDIILHDLLQKHQEKGIRLVWEGNIPPHLPLSDKYLVSLFSNLLKNAFEASVSGEKIEVYNQSRGNYYYLVIKNSYQQEIIEKNGEFITNKEEKSHRGYGTKIIRDIVLDNHGEVVFHVKNKEFVVEITFIALNEMDCEAIRV